MRAAMMNRSALNREIKNRNQILCCGFFFLACLFIVGNTPAHPQVANFKPNELKNIDVIEKLGDTIPLDLLFTNDNGNVFQLADIFNQKKPVIIDRFSL